MDDLLRPRPVSDVPFKARVDPESRSWLAVCAEASGASPAVFPDGDALFFACVEYFEWCLANPCVVKKTAQSGGEWFDHEHEVARPPTMQGLRTYIGVTAATWCRWRGDPRFSDAVEKAENIIYNEKLTGALIGTLNANVVVRVLGLAERNEVSGPGGGPIETSRQLSAEALSDEQIEAALKLVQAEGVEVKS